MTAAPLLACMPCLRWGHLSDCPACAGEGRVEAPAHVPAPVELPEHTEEAVEREVARLLRWYPIDTPSIVAKQVARGVVSLAESRAPLAALVETIGVTRPVADEVVCTIAAALRGRARGLRVHRHGRLGERAEGSARLVEALADRIEKAARDEQRRAG